MILIIIPLLGLFPPWISIYKPDYEPEKPKTMTLDEFMSENEPRKPKLESFEEIINSTKYIKSRSFILTPPNESAWIDISRLLTECVVVFFAFVFLVFLNRRKKVDSS